VSESEILGQSRYFSDIEKLVSFAKIMLEDYTFKYRIKYSYYLFQYYHLRIHEWRLMNGAHVKY